MTADTLGVLVESSSAIDFISYAAIAPSEFNNRFGKKLTPEEQASIRALAESIEQNGLLHPLVVRPKEKDGGGMTSYELIVGERRWRACRYIGMQNIPCRVIKASDEEVQQLILVENQQRTAIEPIREALHFANVRKQVSSWDEVARRTGLPVRTIRKMVELLNLPKKCRQALEQRLISLDQAFLMLGLPKTLTDDELDYLLNDVSGARHGNHREPLSTFETKQVIQQMLGHRLNKANWPLSDDTLPGGACSNCPKRTSCDLLLFEDIVEEDRCLDAKCWDKKVAAWSTRQTQALYEKGCLDPTEAQLKKWQFHGGQLRSPFIGPVVLEEDVPPHLFEDKVRRCKWKTLLSAYLKNARPKRYAVVDDTGQVYEVLEPQAAKKWCDLNKVFGERKPKNSKTTTALRKDMINQMAGTRVHLQILGEINAQWENAPFVSVMAACVMKELEDFRPDTQFVTPAGTFHSKMELGEIVEEIKAQLETIDLKEYQSRLLVALQVIRIGWNVRCNWRGEIAEEYEAWAIALNLNLKKMVANAKSWASKELKKKRL